LTSLELGRAETAPRSQSKRAESTLVTDFSGIGEDIVRLEEGLRRLQLNQTISSLERLEAEHSEGNDEINFKRLSQLLQQVCLLRLPVSLFPTFGRTLTLVISIHSTN
jgi:hypothetical protein